MPSSLHHGFVTVALKFEGFFNDFSSSSFALLHIIEKRTAHRNFFAEWAGDFWIFGVRFIYPRQRSFLKNEKISPCIRVKATLSTRLRFVVHVPHQHDLLSL